MKKISLWYCTVLSFVTAVLYLLAGLNILSDNLGDPDEKPPAVFYAAAGFYLIVSYAVHLKNKWVRTALGTINALVILIFIQMWINASEVLTSPAGLSTKIAQLLLEIGLVYLIIKTWKDLSSLAESSKKQK